MCSGYFNKQRRVRNTSSSHYKKGNIWIVFAFKGSVCDIKGDYRSYSMKQGSPRKEVCKINCFHAFRSFICMTDIFYRIQLRCYTFWEVWVFCHRKKEQTGEVRKKLCDSCLLHSIYGIAENTEEEFEESF